MQANTVDRSAFLDNLRISNLLTRQQYKLVSKKLADVESPREIAKALVSWKLITKFQARMLLGGRNYGFFLGPYRILDVLGQGGMGRVFKALHQTMNRVVALKVLAPQVVKTERAKELFLREVQAAAQLSHPNIVMAYDANELNGRHFLAMEYVDGPNLEQHVRKHGPLPVGLACEIIFQSANGLQHAHERGMVHRDIKPANLLFQKDSDNTIQVKILDFGLARLNSSKISATRENTIAGTPDFLSPEQAMDLPDVDIRADLYSLGCTFFYLLTGRVLFPGGGIVEKLKRHNSEPPPAIDALRAGVPEVVAGIVHKLMAKDRSARFQTPDELMDALAPHAAPTVMDWPISLPVDRRSQDDSVSPQDDTEPRAKESTQIGDEESVLEWIDVNRQDRRRRWLWLCAAIGTGAVVLGTGLAWWILQ